FATLWPDTASKGAAGPHFARGDDLWGRRIGGSWCTARRAPLHPGVSMSRFFRAVSILALAGLFTHCATSSGAGGTASAGDAVPLRFAWPEGTTVQVSSVSTVTQSDQ